MVITRKKWNSTIDSKDELLFHYDIDVNSLSIEIIAVAYMHTNIKKLYVCLNHTK